ncbi:hypothetical protein CTEN210_17330 [Chaetoceros tenuissimus]|uniref:Uncharacterized protein n=1 Tax=Chaetoceros tenuissimus TaxID=426638 RepID=A0AAD3DDX2_9STRA|nr:hypothetical protein CTEN210_17330 [Chaetoceros tenuissimus]
MVYSSKKRSARLACTFLLSSLCSFPINVDAFSMPNGKKPESTRTIHGHDTFDAFVTMRTGIDLNQSIEGSSKYEKMKILDSDNGEIGKQVQSSSGSSAGPDCPAPGSSDMVFWFGEGQLYESPSGKIIANIDGFDVSKGVYVGDGHIRQFSRKIFWFRDPVTNELITEYNGKEVHPIKYDWQVFDLKRGIGADPTMSTILPSVLKGPRSVPCMPVTPRYAGKDVLHYQCPLFIDIPIGNGKTYQAWEIYDYTLDLTHDVNRPPSLSWSRQGSNPPFIEDGNAVMHFLGHRLNKFEDLPDHIQEIVENEYDLFKSPPVDMGEVAKLEEELLEKKKAVVVNGNGTSVK